MNRRPSYPLGFRPALSIAIFLSALCFEEAPLASDYLLKEVAVIPHAHGMVGCPRSLNAGRMAVLGTYGNLFIFNPRNEATPSQRIDLFDVNDVAQVPESNLLLCAGHDLVAVDVNSNTFHLLNTSAIITAGKDRTDATAAHFDYISLHRETSRFMANFGAGFAIGSLTDVNNTRIVFSDYWSSAFLPDGRVVQAGDTICRVCQLTAEGTGSDEMHFRRSDAERGGTVILQNSDQSDSVVSARFSFASNLIRTAGDSESAIVVLPMTRVTRSNEKAYHFTFEIWHVSPKEVKMLSIVSASALHQLTSARETWIDTLVLNLDPGESRKMHVLHLFRQGAVIAEINLSLDGKPQAGPYVSVQFSEEADKRADIVAASWSGGNRVLVADSEGRLRMLECDRAAKQ